MTRTDSGRDIDLHITEGWNMFRRIIFSLFVFCLSLVAGGCARNRHTTIQFEATAGAREWTPLYVVDRNVHVAYHIEYDTEETQ